MELLGTAAAAAGGTHAGQLPAALPAPASTAAAAPGAAAAAAATGAGDQPYGTG